MQAYRNFEEFMFFEHPKLTRKKAMEQINSLLDEVNDEDCPENYEYTLSSLIGELNDYFEVLEEEQLMEYIIALGTGPVYLRKKDVDFLIQLVNSLDNSSQKDFILKKLQEFDVNELEVSIYD